MVFETISIVRRVLGVWRIYGAIALIAPQMLARLSSFNWSGKILSVSSMQGATV